MVRKGVVVHYINMAEVSSKELKKEIAEKILDNSDTKIINPVTFQRLLRWIRDCFWNTLLILDNCDNVLNTIQRDEFQDILVKMVEESLKIKILMTSRTTAMLTKYYEWHKVEELSTEASCMLLESKVPSRIQLGDKQKEMIANLTGNVPLALQIIGSLLHLPASPSPKTIIKQLEEEPILTLSSEELPSDEQVYATISVSYKYLPKEMQVGSHLLTVFPGSFDQQAAFSLFRQSSKVYRYQYHVGGDEIIRYLVRCSLLEHHEHTGRYHFHLLIKEFLLFIQGKEFPQKAENFIPAMHIHYANQLTVASSLIQIHFVSDIFLAFLDLEHHNLEHLLNGMQHMHLICSNSRLLHLYYYQEFLEAVVALASATDTGLMKLRFSAATLCDSIKHSVTQIDKMMPYLEDYLQLLQQEHQRFTQEKIVHSYLALIRQLATCEDEFIGTEAAVQVYAHRKHIVEAKRTTMGSKKYIEFYTELSKYYRRLDQDHGVIECHRLIIQQTNADLAKCQQHLCNYYDIAEAYNAMEKYEEASEFFELSFETSMNTMSKVAALIRLIYTYSDLDDLERLALTTAKLHDLHSDIMNAASESAYAFFYGDSVQIHIVDLYRKVGFVEEAHQLEAKLIEAVKVLSLRITHHHHESIDSGGQVILKMALRVLHRFYEAEDYHQVIKLGHILLNSFQGLNTTYFLHTSMNVSLLIGKAKFHGENLFSGIAQIEPSLKTILKHPYNYTHYQKSTACWYLIPRLIYLDACYRDDIIRYTVNILGFLTCLILSPFPFILVESDNNETKLSQDAQLFPPTHLVTTNGVLNLLSSQGFSILKEHNLTQTITNTVTNLYKIYEYLEELRKILHVYTCTFVVWLKLVLLYFLYLRIQQPKRLYAAISLQSLYLQFSDTAHIIYVVIDSVIVKPIQTRSFVNVKLNFRRLMDPRHKYGYDKVYTDLID